MEIEDNVYKMIFEGLSQAKFLRSADDSALRFGCSIYQLQPLGVVRPRSTQDVLSVVQYAAEHEISIHPRGAGTGVSGESLGRGIVIDFSQ